MPEGAECRIQVDFLNDFAKDKYLIGWSCNSGKFMYEKYRDTMGLDVLEKYLFRCGRPQHYRIKFHAHGKFIWAKIQSELYPETVFYMMCSLAMSGEWTLENKKHNHFSLAFDLIKSPALVGPKLLRYVDPRRFGYVKFTSDFTVIQNKLNQLGINPLDDLSNITDGSIISLFRKFNNKNICEALMNQKVIAGVGNYVKCEALYDTCLSPFDYVHHLCDSDLVNLFNSCRDIIREAYKNQGASFHTFESGGEKGTYANQFKVYGRKIADDGSEVFKVTLDDKRTTHYTLSQLNLIPKK